MSASHTKTSIDAHDNTMASGTAVYVPGQINMWGEECSPEMRWRGTRLQQKWIRYGYGTTGAIETVEHEWRDVPLTD